MTETSTSVGGVTTHAALSDVTTPHVAADLATDCVESAKIKAANVTDAKLAVVKLTRIVETTVASDATTVSFTSLDLNTYKYFLIFVNLAVTDAGEQFISMYVNADTTATNYYSQKILDVDAPATSNNAVIMAQDNTTRANHIIFITRDTGGYLVASAIGSDYKATNAIRSYKYAWGKVATVTNITQLDFTSDVANGIHAGTVITIFGLSG